MENDNLTKTEFMSIRCLEIVAAGLRQRRQEIQNAMEQLQREDAAFAKDRAETFAAIESGHGLPAGSLNTTHAIEPIAQGQAARIIQIAKPSEQIEQPQVQSASIS